MEGSHAVQWIHFLTAQTKFIFRSREIYKNAYHKRNFPHSVEPEVLLR
jgi:hypothetical protein